MTETPLTAAMARLDRAVARIEQARAQQTAAAADAAHAYAELDGRHALLRRRVEETIDRLDALIAQGTPAAGGGDAG